MDYDKTTELEKRIDELEGNLLKLFQSQEQLAQEFIKMLNTVELIINDTKSVN